MEQVVSGFCRPFLRKKKTHTELPFEYVPEEKYYVKEILSKMMKRFNVYFKHPVTDVCMVLESTPVESWVDLNECKEVTLGGNKFLKVANLVIPADRILWIEVVPYDDENECDLVIKKKVNEFAVDEEF